MLCENYLALTPKERTEYIGELIHSCMSDEKLFLMGKRIIKAAEKAGILTGVVINPLNIAPEGTETAQNGFIADERG